MRYKVISGSPTLSGLTGGVCATFAGSIIEPGRYKLILIGFVFLLLAWVMWQMVWYHYRHRQLTFEENTLVFPKRVIRYEDIKHILVYDRNPSFIIYFNQRKMPLSITFSAKDGESIRSELRQWTWKNKVQTKCPGRLRKNRSS